MTRPKKTPLHPFHVARGAKMVPFAGWEMPLYFPGGILEEHRAVRSAAGLFDVSHMGRLEVTGAGALDLVNRMITNNAARLAEDQLLYSCVCNPEGGVLDDVTVYRLDPGVLIVANAANRERIRDWLAEHAGADARIDDRSEEIAHLALQGPAAPRILAPLAGEEVAEGLGYYRHHRFSLEGAEVLVSRNGYTGEDGFEIYLPAERAREIWDRLLELGAGSGLRPVGLGARDTLRLEMAYCLYGNELDVDVTPLEAGLGWTVKFSKGDFIGREALLRQKKAGPPRRLVAMEIEGRSLPRHADTLLHEGREAGRVTSGGFSPSLGIPVALGLVKPPAAGIGMRLEIEGQRGRLPARIVERPFYRGGSARVPGTSRKGA